MCGLRGINYTLNSIMYPHKSSKRQVIWTLCFIKVTPKSRLLMCTLYCQKCIVDVNKKIYENVNNINFLDNWSEASKQVSCKLRGEEGANLWQGPICWQAFLPQLSAFESSTDSCWAWYGGQGWLAVTRCSSRPPIPFNWGTKNWR